MQMTDDERAELTSLREELAALRERFDQLPAVEPGEPVDLSSYVTRTEFDPTQYVKRADFDEGIASAIRMVYDLRDDIAADSDAPPTTVTGNDHVIGDLTPEVAQAIRQEQLAKRGRV